MGEVRQKIRGASVDLDAALGLEGVIAYNITTHDLRVYDGLTLGGYEILNKANTIALIATSAVTAYNSVRLNGQLESFYARSARLINAGVGMTGGGNLTADRTITMGAPSTVSRQTANSATGTTHTHTVFISQADLIAVLTYTPANNVQQIIAGVGLTGGGNLSADRTVSMGTPGTLTLATTNSASGTTHTHDVSITLADFGGVPTTRNIIAGVGMTGGGTLAADRTLTLGTPNTITTASTNAVSGTTHTHALTLTSADITGELGFTPPSNAITISAGVGMTGGGNLTANRTITLGTPSDITNATANSATGTTHTHALGFTAAEVYLGTGAGDLTFPLGAVLFAYHTGAIPARNSIVTPYLSVATAAATSYTLTADGTILSGTWRSRGSLNYTGSAFVTVIQRVG